MRMVFYVLPGVLLVNYWQTYTTPFYILSTVGRSMRDCQGFENKVFRTSIPPTNSTKLSKFLKSKIYKEKSAAEFFGGPSKINRGT